MSVTEEVETAVKKTERLLEADVSFRRLRDFYIDMQRRGLVIKRVYDLPPLDTIGRTLYQTTGPDKPSKDGAVAE